MECPFPEGFGLEESKPLSCLSTLRWQTVFANRKLRKQWCVGSVPFREQKLRKQWCVGGCFSYSLENRKLRKRWREGRDICVAVPSGESSHEVVAASRRRFRYPNLPTAVFYSQSLTTLRCRTRPQYRLKLRSSHEAVGCLGGAIEMYFDYRFSDSCNLNPAASLATMVCLGSRLFTCNDGVSDRCSRQ